jgi:hypothetical protein
LKEGVTRPELRFLDRDVDVGPPRELAPDHITVVPDDDDDRFGLRCGRAAEDVLDERKPRHAMKDLRNRRSHPCPLAGGENDDVEIGHRGAVFGQHARAGGCEKRGQ